MIRTGRMLPGKQPFLHKQVVLLVSKLSVVLLFLVRSSERCDLENSKTIPSVSIMRFPGIGDTVSKLRVFSTCSYTDLYFTIFLSENH